MSVIQMPVLGQKMKSFWLVGIMLAVIPLFCLMF